MTASSLLVEPAHVWVPEYHQTFGPEVGELSALAGFAPDPEQQLIHDAMFAVDKRGRSAAFEVAVIGCRQNLKTGLLKQAALGKTVIMERPLFVWSAHEFRTAQESFRDLTILIESCPDLDQMVKRIYRGNGDESIEWLGGQRIIFKARTKSGGRGLTGDDVGLDEGFALLPAHMGALLPTLSARPDPQVMYASSAGLAYSEVLRSIRDRGRARKDPRLAYFEWCAPDPAEACALGDECEHFVGTPGCGCDRPELWQAANPAMGRRITVEYIAAERAALPPAEFGRERMGWWDKPLDLGGQSPIDMSAWGHLVDAEPANSPTEMRHFGVEVDPDRAFASIAAAGRRADDRIHLEVVTRRRGVSWVLEACQELDRAHGPAVFVIDGGGPGADLIEDFTDASLTVVTAGLGDVAAAAAALVDGVNERSIAHGPDQILDAAVRGARKRVFRDGGFAFGRRASTEDVTPLVGASLAAWALDRGTSIYEERGLVEL